MNGAIGAPERPSVQSALKTALNSQSGPPNPQTPVYRENDEHAWYLALQRVRITAKEAVEHVGDQKGPDVKAILGSLRTAAERLLAGTDPKAVRTSIAADLLKEIRPDLAAQLEQPTSLAGPPPFGAQDATVTPPTAEGPLAAGAAAPPPPTPAPDAGVPPV